ncbi:MAG TPA: protein phosphatase 2C domain-containing protein [Bryobacteraceae bacterium]|nr:protein phosphatase 2C domain-containing protein [Bryobacteraceae bacterium]
MKTAAPWRAGVATDTGMQRANNEDRVHVDEAAGVFLVVDGVGGHAAGERAAEIAVKTIPEKLAALDGDVEDRIRRAIAAANDEIFDLAQSDESCRGMACVLTLVVAHDDHVTVGHVGDSRLYLVWNGVLRKLTADHSPVGELEDVGRLTEDEAMRHPRRNEVFRDVGSRPRDPYEEEFIEVKTVLFRPDAALLICSDGLSDVLTSARIGAIVESYDGDPGAAARRLVDAANAAGGKDNISAVFVAGPEFRGAEAGALFDFQPRHVITRKKDGRAWWKGMPGRIGWMLGGMLLGVALWSSLERLVPRPAPVKDPAVSRAAVLAVKPGDPTGVIHALSAAQPGDVVEIPGGEFLGPIQLKEGVSLIGRGSGRTILRAADTGIAVVARGIRHARVQGIRIAGDPDHPLRTGVLIANSAVELIDLDITGAQDAGVWIEGESQGALLANFIHDNTGSGVVIQDSAAPRLSGNTISGSAGRPGLDVRAPARPSLENNVVTRKPGAP